MIQQFYFGACKPENSYTALQNEVHDNVHLGKAKNRSLSTYPSVKQLISKMWNMFVKDYYAVIKRRELGVQTTT